MAQEVYDLLVSPLGALERATVTSRMVAKLRKEHLMETRSRLNARQQSYHRFIDEQLRVGAGTLHAIMFYDSRSGRFP